MDDIEEDLSSFEDASSDDDLSSFDDLSISLNSTDIEQSKTTSAQANNHVLHIHCLSETRTLQDNRYTSVKDIKMHAFALYENGMFNDDNAILTYLDNNKTEVLLTSVPDLSEKRQSTHLFIRFVCIFFLDECITNIDNFLLGSSYLRHVFESIWCC
jgi:hypothetical protein